MSTATSLSRPLDVRQVRTREALRAAVLDLTASKQFAAISVGEIAATAGVGAATFYRHYRDKDALLADVATDFTDEMLAMLTPVVVTADSRSASLALCRFIDDRREICAALLTGGAKNAVRERIVERAVAQSRLSGIADTIWLPGDLGPVHMVTSIVSILAWWLQADRELTPERMSVLIDRLILRPALAAR